MSSPEVSIVIPVFNEAALVGAAADELRRELDARGVDYELIFAENGSRDATPAILDTLSSADPRIRWFHSDRPNYGAALKQGIEQARGQWVICDEVDLCDVAFYDRALPLLRGREADLVIGSKTAKGASDRRPLVRRAATRLHNKLLRVALGFRGTDTHGLKAFRRSALAPVVAACRVDMDVFASELVVRAWREGVKVIELPIQLQEKRKPSIHLLRRVPSVLKNLARLVYIVRIRGE